MYDGVHRGHQFLINYLKLQGEARGEHPVVVTFEEHPQGVVHPLEAPRLLTSTEERLRLLEEAGIEEVVLLHFTEHMRHLTARAFLTMLHERFAVDTLLVGFNHRFGHNRKDGFEQYQAIGQEIGMEILEAPEYKGKEGAVSSSIIRQYLASGQVAEAEKALGHPYSFHATVVEGNHMGRTIEYPTANLEPVNPQQLIPMAGVYAVVVTTPDGVRRPGMMNIGFRPTVAEEGKSESPLTLEVHILDFTGYLYGEELEVEMVELLRSEKKFPSLAKLKKQLTADAARTRALTGRGGSPGRP